MNRSPGAGGRPRIDGSRGVRSDLGRRNFLATPLLALFGHENCVLVALLFAMLHRLEFYWVDIEVPAHARVQALRLQRCSPFTEEALKVLP